MKKTWTVVLVLFLAGCTAPLLTGNRYANEQIPLTITLPGDPAATKVPKPSRSTKKRFREYTALLAENPAPQILFYSGGNDNPDQIPYSAVGSLITALDTARAKTNGFANRKINAQPYLHKTTIDKANRVVAAEYIVKLPANYFYLFASAPITKAILQNEEAMIVVQDSLNRKYSAAIGTLQYK